MWNKGQFNTKLSLAVGRGFLRRRQWHPTPVLLPGKSREWRSLVDCSPWGHWEWNTTERLHFHFSLSVSIGEGNGSPLHYSCLENLRDRGAWWAAIFGVAQSRTLLKRFSSSNSRGFLSLALQSVIAPFYFPLLRLIKKQTNSQANLWLTDFHKQIICLRGWLPFSEGKLIHWISMHLALVLSMRELKDN